jgi:DNA-directed RNA polymerase specialized sigma subunit
MTQHEVARALGISQGRVLQLEQSAIRKLRRLPEAKALLKLVRFEPETR